MKQLALYFFSLLLLISCATVEPIIIESPEGINYDVSSAQIKLDSSDIIKTEQPIQKTRIIESILKMQKEHKRRLGFASGFRKRSRRAWLV